MGKLWRQAPAALGAGLGEANVLLDYQRPLAALQLLTVLEPTVSGGDRRMYWESWFAAAQVLASKEGNGALGEVARAQARRVVREEAAYGSAVDFLLQDHLVRLELGEVAGSSDGFRREARKLVHAHIQLFLAGGDPNVTALLRSLAWVEDLDGRDAALMETETLLAKDPSLMGVWRLRAELLEQAGRPREAVAELRSVLAHVLDPDLVWTLARIAGEEGISTPADEALVQEAYGEDVSSPDVALVRGLLALRAGRYGEADSLLASSSPRPDGAHLYYRALANLPLPGAAPARRARRRGTHE